MNFLTVPKAEANILAFIAGCLWDMSLSKGLAQVRPGRSFCRQSRGQLVIMEHTRLPLTCFAEGLSQLGEVFPAGIFFKLRALAGRRHHSDVGGRTNGRGDPAIN